MKQPVDIAIETFRSGFNCSQSVLTAYSEKLNFDKSLALMISCGFGGGMGRLQETCGAVTGAFMVLGIYNSQKYSDNKEKKENAYKMIQDFNKRFIAIHQTTNCKKILNIDLNTEAGMKYAYENKLFDTICEKCVSDALKIVDEMIH